jgi:thiol-disulfide isomerase/thioredoxin
MRRVLPVAVLLFSSAWGAAQSPQQPDLNLKDLSGRNLRLADYKGKVLLVNFWATWCIPCRSEIPDLVKWQRQYRAQGLQIIGITYPPQTGSEVRRYVKKVKVNYPVAIGTKATKARFTTSETLPITVVIDRDGNVCDVVEGIMYPDEFEQKVKSLLIVKASSP